MNKKSYVHKAAKNFRISEFSEQSGDQILFEYFLVQNSSFYGDAREFEKQYSLLKSNSSLDNVLKSNVNNSSID
jgi:hypothetical protein